METSEGEAVTSPAAAEERKGGGENKKMKVVVAIDGSDEGMYALTWAVDYLLTSTGGVPDTTDRLCSLIVVHVRKPVPYLMAPVGPAIFASSSVIDSVKKAQEETSAHVLNKALELCKERLVKAQTMVVDGEPKDMICQVAEKLQADLLVVGSRGLGNLKRAILGSVSDYVAHHARCPVLIVKPPKEQHHH